MNKYLIETRNSAAVADHDALKFWSGRRESYPRLVRLAQDLVCEPASQAFVKRIFSTCGILTAGRRNRMQKSLEMRVFLRMNAHFADNLLTISDTY